jgi:hypothetical protein
MKFVLITLVFVFTAFNVFSAGIRDSMNENIDNNIEYKTIVGRVQVYGNSPFTFVGIIDENDTEYAVYPPAKERELRALQGHLIRFTVILFDEPRGPGGFSLRGGTVEPINWEIIE